MTTTLLTKPPCTHREEQPVRECERCGAYLRSFTPGSLCDPCSRPSGIPSDKEVIGTLIDATSRERENVFDALQRVWEAMP